MRENQEYWKGQLETIIIEIVGLHNILHIDDNVLILLSKLEGLKEKEVDFMVYRKNIFESITLLRNLKFYNE